MRSCSPRGGIYAGLWNRQRQVDEAQETLRRAERRRTGGRGRALEPQARAERRGAVTLCRIWRQKAAPPTASVPMSVLEIHSPPARRPSTRRLSVHRGLRGGDAASSAGCGRRSAGSRSIATLWCAYFFRDPARVTPLRGRSRRRAGRGRRLLRRPAPSPPPELGLGARPMQRVSIFMSVFDCHVNRAPVEGRVRRVAYKPGLFLNADLDKASEDNERNGLVIENAAGAFGVVQIAGLIARRIVCFTQEGAHARRRRPLRPHPFRLAGRRLSARRARASWSASARARRRRDGRSPSSARDEPLRQFRRS